MGSNMQRQAVPLIRAEAPYVGTGLEGVVARDSRAVLVAAGDGIVCSATADRVVVSRDGKRPEDTASPDSVRVYPLYKFLRSNASTLINQRPTVRTGDRVKRGDVIADGASTDQGELALGRNVMVAFMPWRGYNFEDAIVVSERLVKDDVYTSIHISEYDIVARDTKLGPEEITRDIPNVGDEALRNLDSEGVVRIGAEVKAGDILVGKITPKSETELAPEERLLRAIFGEKAADVKDSSLVVSGGCSGIVMDVRIERRVDPTKEKLTRQDVRREIKEAGNAFKAQLGETLDELADKLADILLGSKLPVPILRAERAGGGEIIPADRKITKVMLKKLAQSYDSYSLPDGPAKDQIDEVTKGFRIRIRDITMRRDETIERLEQGDGTDPGVIKSVKVYVASKRRVSVGDKMAGRHGNKGIVAKIVPVEDMPFMADGTPVDIVLNPLGVPSRMNVGQVLETHVGWAAHVLGLKVATPVFDGMSEERIHALLQEAKAFKVKEMGWTMADDGRVLDGAGRSRTDGLVDVDGKTRLCDGRTGSPFAQRVMVGQIYMLKLDHLVVNKIHARAVGPYSLVTQQPLGGKAQHGGQRFGEMEVWALEAYGAAHTLQEMLTVKSDDVVGRTKIYESIMRGDNTLEAGTPESFNVLMREMMSLCLDVRVRHGKAALA
jgi:DNA-directed RNA polymerase subunit beta